MLDTATLGLNMSRHRTGDEFAELFPHLRDTFTVTFVAAFGPNAGRATAADVLTYARHHWVRLRHRHDLAFHLFRLGRRMGRRHLDRLGDDPAAREFAALTIDERLAVILHRGVGWDFDQIAEITGMSVASLHRHHDHGLAKLNPGMRNSDAA